MNMDKLKPWNWFKHEDNSVNQVPISKNEASSEVQAKTKSLSTSQNQVVGSLLQLHREMDRLFDGAWRTFGMPADPRTLHSASIFDNSLFENSMLGDYRAKLDISGNEKEYEVLVELPSMSQDDIHIELSGNTLTVKGQKEEQNERKDNQYYRLERNIGSFQRTLSLPDDVDRDEIMASMKNGLLVIKIPRITIPSDDIRHISITS
jgi:HSP20 family protein